jgi:acyl-coenzyme A synthetase/AMP-(fatty) acid ligase
MHEQSYLKNHLTLKPDDKVMIVFMNSAEFAPTFLACMMEKKLKPSPPAHPGAPPAHPAGGIADTFRRFGVKHLVNAKDALAYDHGAMEVTTAIVTEISLRST